MGTGKTITALLHAKWLIEKKKLRHVHVIAPVKVVDQWRYHVHRLQKQITVSENKYTIDVSTYHTGLKALLYDREEKERKSTMLIVDEAHNFRFRRIRVKKGERWQDYKRTSKTCKLVKIARKRADKVLLLTGTPVSNRMNDITAQLYVLNGIGINPNNHQNAVRMFKTPFPELHSTKKMGLSERNERQLFRSALEKISFFRSSVSSDMDIPSVKTKVVILEMPIGYFGDYAVVETTDENFIGNKLVEGFSDISYLERKTNFFYSRLRKASNTMKCSSSLSLPSSSPKEEWVARRLSQWLVRDSREKVVLYSHFISHGVNPLKTILFKQGIKFEEVVGLSNERRVYNAVADFNAGVVRVMVMSSSAAEGLDLKGVTRVVLMEPYWNNARINQVVARTARYDPARERLSDGSLKKIRAYILVLRKPVESVLEEESVHDVCAFTRLKIKCGYHGDEDDDTFIEEILQRPSADEILLKICEKKERWIEDEFFELLRTRCVDLPPV
jgi:SNF2 family DNA or RNA helicase